MVRVLFTLALATSAVAFAPANTAGRIGTELSAVESYKDLRKTIANMDKDNFSSSLAEIEDYLVNDAGATMYKKSMRRISTAAKHIGTEVPAEFAKAAKATQKRREKQDAFVKQKIAEAAEAAEAAAAEAAEAVEEAADSAEEAVES
eukprot:scaffold7696_cov141-Cylindrotheca_fusiformis.AAC.10